MDTPNGAKKSLTLLGIWNILPIGIWTWFNDISVAQLEKLTGRRLGTFCYIKNDLNYECFMAKDTDMLKEDLDKLPPSEQLAYVQKITDDYYVEAPRLEEELQKAEGLTLASLDNAALATVIEDLTTAWSKVTMQIWYAVLLDIWYPLANDKATIKAIIAKARDHCGHQHERSDKIEHELYMEAGKRLGLSEREVYFTFQPELVDGLRGKEVSKEKIATRLELWVATNDSGTFECYGGDEAQAIINQFAVPAIGPKKEGALKGTPACVGKITGTAHVILLDKEFPEFKEGEILVSLQTMVHYIPLMKKSSAILTEFGGLTSHAAIVSRELKKPCVVGISGLISTIKTGDQLEIDAAAGTVKIV